jgi:REP element-mobilizing transposase RayT
MPRIARGLVNEGIYHVVNRGNGRQEVFHKEKDYEAFVGLIQEARNRWPVKALAYCIMPNHFHMALVPERGGQLSPWMQWLMTSHVRRYHRYYGSSGHMWQGRYKSFIVQNDNHLLMVLRYIEGNPVRAAMVKSAKDWAWSSHRLPPFPLRCRNTGPAMSMSRWRPTSFRGFVKVHGDRHHTETRRGKDVHARSTGWDQRYGGEEGRGRRKQDEKSSLSPFPPYVLPLEAYTWSSCGGLS